MNLQSKPKRPSFSSVAERKYRLSGTGPVKAAFPYLTPLDEIERRYAADPGSYLNLAHYDYLGLARHPEVIKAAHDAIDAFGPGAGASRVVGGERSVHKALERDMAEFIGADSCLTMISGYLTNASLITHVLGPRDLVLVDELAHNSIMVAARNGKFACEAFTHNDLDDLNAKLVELRGQYNNVLIAVEGLYSMDGDYPDLPRLMEMKRQHDAWLLVDEAHSHGVMGATGRGVCEHFGIDPREIELIVGTLSKSFVSAGGFVCTGHDIVDWFEVTLPGFIYSVGLAPATVSSAHAALNVLKREPERVARLTEVSTTFKDAAIEAGLDVGPAVGQAVVPLLFDTVEETLMVSHALLDAGIFAPPIAQVAVPKDKPRIRCFFSAGHREEDLLRAVDVAAAAVRGDAPAKIASS